MSDEKAPRTYGWLKLYAVLPRNPKIAALTDAEFRAFVYALCSAREQDIVGEWQDLTYLTAALGRKYARHVPTLLERELIVENEDETAAPHKWNYWQPKDYGAAERKALSRAESQTSPGDVTPKSLRGDRQDGTGPEGTGPDAIEGNGTSSFARATPDGSPLASLSDTAACRLCRRKRQSDGTLYCEHRNNPAA